MQDDPGATRQDGDQAPEPAPRYRRGEEVIGQGAIGRVVSAWDDHLDREVARKELMRPEDSPAADRFLREARITARLEHPGIVPVHDLGRTEEGVLFYTMKRLRGRTLAQAIAETPDLEQRLPLLEAFVDLCQCVAYAHNEGVLHRDLKPENVIVGGFGETVLVDWGLAVVLDEVAAGEVVGSPRYMSPEQARGERPTPASDLWSLGMVLFELLAGHAPFSGSTEDVLEQVRQGKRPDLPDSIPPELASVVDKALQPDPDVRYATASELAREVREWRRGNRVTAYDYSTTELLQRLIARNRPPLVVAAIAAMVGLAGAVVAVDRIRSERDEAETQRDLATVRYADALLQSARAAHADGQAGRTLVLAATSLATTPTPEARGLAVAALSRGVPELAWTAPTDECWTVSASPDGTLVGCTLPGAVRVWDVATGTLQMEATYEGPPTHAFAWSPSGRYVASGRTPQTLVWDVTTGDVVRQLDIAEADGTWAAVFDGESTLITGGMSGRIQVWDLPAAQPTQTLEGHTRRINALSLFATGQLASGSADGSTAIWDLKTGSATVLPFPAEGASAVAFTPDGLLFSAGSRHGSAPVLHVWSPSGRHIRDIPLRQGDAGSIAVSDDVVVVGLRTGVARVYDLRTWTLRSELTFPGEQNIKSVVVRGDTLHAIGDRGRIRTWRLPDRAAPGDHDATVSDLCFHGEDLISVAADGQVAFWDAASGRSTGPELQVLERISASHCTEGSLVVGSPDGRVASLDLESRTTEALPSMPPGVMRFSRPTGLAAATTDGRLHFGETVTDPVSEDLWALTTLPDGDVLVGLRYGEAVLRLDGTNGEERARLAWPDDPGALAVHPDGTLVAIGGIDGTFRTTSADLEPTGMQRELSDASIRSMAWSPDGTRLAIAAWDGTVWFTDRAGAITATLPAHGNRLQAVTFSPDGKRAASGGSDRRVYTWTLDALDADPAWLLQEAERRTGLVVRGGTAEFSDGS